MSEQAQIEQQPYRLGIVTTVVTVMALLMTGATITAEVMNIDLLAYISKVVALALIMLVAFISYDPPSLRYKWTIIFGLLFSLVGDVLLMVPDDLFLFGLIAFAVAQIVYITAFASVGGLYTNYKAAVPLLLYGVFMAAFLWTGLQDAGMVVPALGYLVIILIMAWQGYGQWRQTLETRAMLAFVGVLLFVASDSLLAVNRFAFDLGDLAPILVLGTYYPAQWLIAQSAGRKHI